MPASATANGVAKGGARASANIALIKYWGKRAGEPGLNLPAVGSVSITLDGLASTTRVELDPSLSLDEYRRGGEERPQEAQRVTRFLDRIRRIAGSEAYARVSTENNFPTGAGLASSASGFAALAAAAASAYGLDLDERELSKLARDGSGSAARSIFGGFVRMHRGEREDGGDSFAEPVFPAEHWPLKVIVAVTDEAAKSTGSTDGMRQTERTSAYFSQWVDSQPADLAEAEVAIRERDFGKLAAVSEYSCMKMHASALAARPAVIYWNAATLAVIAAVRELQSQGEAVFFTIDAGPQVKAVCLPESVATVAKALRSVPGVQRILETGLGQGVEIIK